MELEIVIYLFTLWGIVILCLGNAYYKQKMVNRSLKERFVLNSKLKFFESGIERRQVYLNRYDLQKFNLHDALIPQYFGKK